MLEITGNFSGFVFLNQKFSEQDPSHGNVFHKLMKCLQKTKIGRHVEVTFGVQYCVICLAQAFKNLNLDAHVKYQLFFLSF